MLARDIKNLVGRAGRAGSSSRGLVICANPDQWPVVAPVARGLPGEVVEGALIELLRELESALARSGRSLTNNLLEGVPALLSLVDGVDASLLELIHEEIGDEEFRAIAERVYQSTFAVRRATGAQAGLLLTVFRMRADRLVALRSSGRLDWVRESGGRPRIVDSIIDDLIPSFDGWADGGSDEEGRLIEALLNWSMRQPGFRVGVDAAFDKSEIGDVSASLVALIRAWVTGKPYVEMAAASGLAMDHCLRVHAQVVLNDFATLVEQAVAVIRRYSDEAQFPLSDAVLTFPERLRFGVASSGARFLMASGVRHRSAAVALGAAASMEQISDPFTTPRDVARALLADRRYWEAVLGSLVYARTRRDVRIRRSVDPGVAGRPDPE